MKQYFSQSLMGVWRQGSVAFPAGLLSPIKALSSEAAAAATNTFLW